MIEARELTERSGGSVAVEDLSFRVHSRIMTGFLAVGGRLSVLRDA